MIEGTLGKGVDFIPVRNYNPLLKPDEKDDKEDSKKKKEEYKEILPLEEKIIRRKHRSDKIDIDSLKKKDILFHKDYQPGFLKVTYCEYEEGYDEND